MLCRISPMYAEMNQVDNVVTQEEDENLQAITLHKFAGRILSSEEVFVTELQSLKMYMPPNNFNTRYVQDLVSEFFIEFDAMFELMRTLSVMI